MSRKPITTYAGGKGPRQLIWEAIRAMADVEAFDDKAIWHGIPCEARLHVSLNTVRDYRYALVNAGILQLVSVSPNRRDPSTYRLIKNEGLDAPRVRRDGNRVTQGLAQEQMWRTLRMLSADINAHELAAHAGTTGTPVALAAAQDYLIVLNQAGYLTVTREGRSLGHKGSSNLSRYRLKASRNTGPRPPMVCRTKVVYDPNEDQVVWAARVTDEDAIHGK